MKPLSRRTVLRGLGGSAIALPWLEAMSLPGGGVAAAAPGISASGFPKRYLNWTTGNGFLPPIWNPSGTETSFTMRPVHASLEPFKKDFVIVAGLNMAACQTSKAGGDYHSRGQCSMLSGTESLVNVSNNGLGGESRSSGGITIDQEIAKRLAPKTKFTSLEMGFHSAGGAYGTASYLDAGKPLPAAKDPVQIFNRIFGGGTGGGAVGDPMAAARIKEERKSLLDSIGQTYQGLLPKVGAADRDKLDSHLTQIRELEMRLALAPAAGSTGGGGGCPKTPTAPGSGLSQPDTAKALVDLMAMAIACDLTRVGTMQWGWTTNNDVYSFLGVSRGHHDMSHDGDDVAATVASLTKIETFFMDQLGALATKLKAIPEGNGTALDNTLIMHATDLSRGKNGHTFGGIYRGLLGHAGGALKTGRLLRYNGDADNKLLVSILNMFDIPATTFGNPSIPNGPLSGL